MALSFRLVPALVALGLVVGAPAFAQDSGEEGPATMFIDFNDMLIDGELLAPQGMFATERGQADFGTLLSLRRSFMNEIEEAAHEGALQ
jgi:hypothetical protein